MGSLSPGKIFRLLPPCYTRLLFLDKVWKMSQLKTSWLAGSEAAAETIHISCCFNKSNHFHPNGKDESRRYTERPIPDNTTRRRI
jgi:hypothetical protein